MTDRLVSIIIPIYNVEPYIERCLCSVINQTYRRLEVILVDDSSTDNSMLVAKKYVDSANNTEILFSFLHHVTNQGAATARNTGIRHVKGEYIYFLDGDDEITHDCIERLVEPLHSKLYDFVIADFQTTGGTVGCKHLGFEGMCPDVLRAYQQGVINAMPVNKLVRTTFLKDNQLMFKDGMPFEDELWSFQLACLAHDAYGVKNQSYIYHLRPDSTMGKADSAHFIEWRFRIAPMMWEFIDEHNLSYNEAANSVVEGFFQSAHPIFVIDKGMEGYRYYKRIRKMNHRSNRIYWKLSRKSKMGFVKFFHYLLPAPLGFGLKVVLRKLNGG